ncbi:hypothetical protein TH25_00465 [Thalassospira profundimaris]|uniref:Uncharacterized protein n=1 Tax=Thalassospira profundimaris TaxID=502049 RepID=A0A367XJP0_9PROT|nr:hypothetical protein TH25_00465 [Thalassospira profundimaris]
MAGVFGPNKQVFTILSSSVFGIARLAGLLLLLRQNCSLSSFLPFCFDNKNYLQKMFPLLSDI